ncbi:hypothetical protein HX004_14120 [Myroides sp. 1354]|uniref:hypothetical protein n=1 Tax=unclassified Myroides TaxID=2642485 RepID=UPI002576F4B0|nr:MULTISPECIES: hypothetical protein [unclassified Myroides]MDM1045891.1 hypothetical protein [Myroides sp. R163-1]MDM1056901.1 hypothetical protein [Myroides sp. 1354]MDM1070096.1 hypothetical protein [Myroides sp. 1372]
MSIDLTGKRVLRLTLSKKPFEVMVTGEKDFEHRKKGKWIESRLFDKKGNKRDYDLVLFFNGYGNDKPYFIVEYKGFEVYDKCVSLMSFYNGLTVDARIGDYIIQLGKILEIGNYDNRKHTSL